MEDFYSEAMAEMDQEILELRKVIENRDHCIKRLEEENRKLRNDIKQTDLHKRGYHEGWREAVVVAMKVLRDMLD